MMDPEREAAVWARVLGANCGNSIAGCCAGTPAPAVQPPAKTPEPVPPSATPQCCHTSNASCRRDRTLLAAAVLCLAVCRQSCRVCMRPAGQ